MKEKKAWKINGYLGILLIVCLLGLGVFMGMKGYILVAMFLFVIGALLITGIATVQPNQAYVLTFFGKYVGSIRESGLFLTVPLSIRKKVSLRVRNFNSKTLKVNDVEGNPIEIAAVVVFKVIDSAKAVFDVDHYEDFVEIQSETALRHVATKYPYDNIDELGMTLRGNAEEISNEITKELQDRLNVAGVDVVEARLTHLAYSTEIASAMLQRQQASAIVSARQKIVDGAVGMAQMAIEQLEKNGTIDLDEERKVAMINNLMVAIISDRGAQPVVNTGSLY
ncbi:SPFH domain-containing protein [Bacillus chungangensis]|uniref:Regulator of protease activity HflC (Stomatin/prohibitin superfamily) n=1 Tax=Bacillus chungangensis TaxID=587633 RepID=A0ABT9WNH8_9BACI|nr:SPFH domain-containing protein [Bacillus chungangensis]MDQ0174834.1 regulator of protease activity HflC (stomatin/prohibitin superfamily) [Bacillus chungangensis]